MIEKDVKNRVRKIIERYEQQGHVFWTYWPVQTGFGKHGVPDLLLCLLGQQVGIETKVDGKDPTGRQWYELHEIEKARGISLVIDQHNLEDIETVFNAIIHGNINEARKRAKTSIALYKLTNGCV